MIGKRCECSTVRLTKEAARAAPGWDASPSQATPRSKFAGTLLYTWVKRGTVRVNFNDLRDIASVRMESTVSVQL